jgi:hypothetical protein
MSELRERIAAERARLKQVRQSLSAAVAQGAEGSENWVPYYIAVGNYFEAAMERLHEQDIRMGKLLREKADLSGPAAQQAMLELKQRLEGNQLHLERFLAAKRGLESSGASALNEFESAARAYTDYIVANMGHHSGTTDLARDAFSPADWEHMALVSDADRSRELELFEAVFKYLPDNLKLSAT